MANEDQKQTGLVQQSISLASHELFMAPVDEMNFNESYTLWSVLDLFAKLVTDRKEALRQRLFGHLKATPKSDKGHHQNSAEDGGFVQMQMRGGKKRKFAAKLALPVLKRKKMLYKGSTPQIKWEDETVHWTDIPEEDREVIEQYCAVEHVPNEKKVARLVVDGDLTEDDGNVCTTPPGAPTPALVVEKAPWLVEMWDDKLKELQNAVQVSGGSAEVAAEELRD